MTRPQLTIYTKAGINYDAEAIHLNFNNTVTFFSSGDPVTLPADEIVRVEYNADGASWCPYCDQFLAHFIHG